VSVEEKLSFYGNSKSHQSFRYDQKRLKFTSFRRSESLRLTQF